MLKLNRLLMCPCWIILIPFHLLLLVPGVAGTAYLLYPFEGFATAVIQQLGLFNAGLVFSYIFMLLPFAINQQCNYQLSIFANSQAAMKGCVSYIGFYFFSVRLFVFILAGAYGYGLFVSIFVVVAYISNFKW